MSPQERAAGPIDLRDLLDEELPPQRWALAGYVERPGHLVVAGRAGSGKTMLAMQLAIQASAATPVGYDLGLLDADAPRSRVAIVDGEMGRRRYQRRIRSMGLYDVVQHGEITYVPGSGIDLSSPGDREYLSEVLLGHDFIVIDSLKKLTRGLAENDNDDMGAVVADLTELSKSLDATLVTLHHRGTGDKAFRGATAILDQCDAMVTWAKVGGDDESGVRKLSARGDWTKIRDGAEPEDRYFEMTETGILLPTGKPEPTPREAPEREALSLAIVRIITEAGGTYYGSRAKLQREAGPDASASTFKRAYEAVAQPLPDNPAAHRLIPDAPSI